MLQNAYASATNRNMPYIVTTKRPRLVAATREKCAELVLVSRHAVATLEDDSHRDVLSEVARIMLRAGVVQQGAEWARIILRLQRDDLSPVGPLPDGTVIEVERATMDPRVGSDSAWLALAEEAEMPNAADRASWAEAGHELDRQAICDAWNARRS